MEEKWDVSKSQNELQNRTAIKNLYNPTNFFSIPIKLKSLGMMTIS